VTGGAVLSRSLEILLAVALLVGGALVSQSMWKKADLTREHNRLMQKTGQLVITDPTKVHMRALDTGDPLHFAWRAYFPANYNFAYNLGGGSSGWGTQSDPWEGILRVRLREVDGHMRLYYRFIGGSGLSSTADGMQTLMKEDPALLQKLRVEQLAKDGPVTFGADEVRTLLKITLPDEMLPSAKQKLKSWEYKKLTPTIEWIRFGPHGVLEKEMQAQRGQ
jgi:hypothetical protein